MSQKLKNFVRNNDNIVILVCDYYQTKQIPSDMTEIRDNLAFFPVANVPLIDYVIKSLLSNSINNIILCGSRIEKIIKHVEVVYKNKINFVSINGEPNLGEVLRYINDVVHEPKDCFILYANHYTNLDFKLFAKEHKEKKNLVTFFVHKNRSNSQVKHFYGTKNDEIVFYERCVNDKINMNHIKSSIEKRKTIEFNLQGSSPNLAMISKKVFQLFTDNFDFTCLGDLLDSILAFNPFDLKIGIYEPISPCSSYKDAIYSMEILTLYDYFRFTEDNIKLKIEDICTFFQISDVLKFENNYYFELPTGYIIENTENTVLGYDNRLEDDFCIKDSSVGNRCRISGNIKKCIIWDDVDINEDLEEIIVFGNGHRYNVHYLELESDIEEEEVKKGNFFDDIINYLNEVNMNKDLYSILKQINLIRIIWNASNLDFIEAFSMFLINYLDDDNLEMSTINASAFFPLLHGCVNCVEDQEELLCILYNLMNDNDVEYKKQVLFRFGYLFIEDGIIGKNVLKKYNKMIKKGIF